MHLQACGALGGGLAIQRAKSPWPSPARQSGSAQWQQHSARGSGVGIDGCINRWHRRLSAPPNPRRARTAEAPLPHVRHHGRWEKLVASAPFLLVSC